MAAKIKDGLFIGDAETSQSEVFINDNKISNLINLAGREVHNVWASHGLVYLTYYWEDRPDYKLFSSHEDALLTDIVEFIDVSISHGISVLLFSRNGTGRCVVAACLYLMMKYRWGFEKTYDYVYSKKPDIDLNKGFIQQMFALDMKLLAARQKAQAVKYGVDNGFKIEANMTISDISAMLPPVEAKRWNGWDPAYVMETAELAAQQSDGESKGEGGRYKDNKADHKRSGSDARRSASNSTSLVRTSHGGTVIHGPGTGEDDELILIYSFLNSKNTITVLPGPYLDVYEIPKNFKLKFNPVCYEEDVNWFPSARTKAERVVLKGSRARLAAQTAAVYAQPKSPVPSTATGAGGQSRGEAADSKRFSDAKALEPVNSNNNNNSSNSNGAYSAGAKSVVALENIAPMHVIRSQREAAAAELNSHHQQQHNQQYASNNSSNHNNNTSSSSGNHSYNNHNSGSMQDDSGAGAQMYYAHPSMSNSAAPNTTSSSTSAGQTGEAYFNPDHSPPTSAYSSPVHSSTHKEAQRGNSNNSGGSGQSPNLSNDLYEFVGISTDQGTRSKTSREAPQRTWGPRDSIAVHKDHSSSSLQSAVSQQQQVQQERGYGSRSEDYKDSDYSRQQVPSSSGSRAGASVQQPLSAEDRLRNLMADMQRHKAGAASSGHGPSSSSSASEARDSGNSRGPTGPSLYELATMQIPSTSSGARQHSSSSGGAAAANSRRDVYDQDMELEALDQDSEVDPLSAFQRIQDQPYGTSSGGSRGPGAQGGAVRARHDVITGRPGSAGASGRYPASSTGAPAGPRNAWGGSSTGPTGTGGSRGTSPASSRPASPQPGASSGSSANNNVPSRYASPSAKRTTSGPGGSASVSSNLSVNSINSAGSNQVVGAGANSGSRVYRHGSPAPNVSRTNTAGLAPRSSPAGPSVGRQHILASSGQQGSSRALQANSSIANSSVSSLGSGIVGAGQSNNAGTQRPLSSSGRYASPSAAQQQPTRRAPQSSNAAAANLYSAEALQQQQQQQQGERMRRSVNSSPMRGSSGSGGLSSSGGAGGNPAGVPRRYASPGPQQQQQQYDFDSLASGGTAGSGSRPGSRSGTPTSGRATWRF